ncbi:MAG: hypothetical protein A2Z14_05765 [Chloroflexi bacterium RBG_16_48_8]|nr:MAG: hypothetical protein A2Z14_05765 [Chloroflexi bacterium RBG_16_48_8]
MSKFSRIRLLPCKKHSRSFASQSLTEFAIVLPFVLLVLFVIIEIARLIHAWMAIENGARFGVRYAVTGEYNPDKCPLGGCSDDTDFDLARIDSIHDTVWAGSSSIVRVKEGQVDATQPSFFHVVVCRPKDLIEPDSTDPSSMYECVPAENGGRPSERVMVVVENNHPVLTPFLSAIWPHLRLSAKSEAVVEGYRVMHPEIEPPDFVPPSPQPTNTAQNPTITPTASITPTTTPTPTPDCDLIRISAGLRFQGEDLVMRVRNDNPMNAYLSNSELHARNVTNSPPAYLDWMSFGFSKYYIAKPPVYFNPAGDVVTGGLWIPLGGRSTGVWRGDFEDALSPFGGDFSVRLVFKFDNWPQECPLADAAHLEIQPTRTPWPTWTPGPTNTPRPTNTPGPSPTPYPTRAPRPTKTQKPTNTPSPTWTPQPTKTNTPIPTVLNSPVPPPD